MLHVRGVTKSFGAVEAVRGVSLSVGAGEVFGLLGPNGAGKSTTIAMIAGLLEPDAGVVELGGVRVGRAPASRRGIGLCPQSIALYDELSAVENLEFFGAMNGMNRSERARAAAELLAEVGLTERGGARVGTFSGGMKRRLNLAAALMHGPGMVLLDEPTAGVDPQSRNAILELVFGLRARGKSVIYTTHFMEEAAKVCDRVAIMDHGRVLAEGTVAELIARFGGRTVLRWRDAGEEMRDEPEDPARALAGLLASGSAADIRVDRPDLEGVFLTLTGRSLRD